MANPLKDFQDLVTTTKQTTLIGKVVAINGQKVKVKLNTNNEIVVWGVAEIGNSVLVENGQIVAVVTAEKEEVAYIA